MNKLCFYSKDQKNIFNYVRLYELNETPENMDGMTLSKIFYVFKNYPYISRLMSFCQITMQDTQIVKYDVNYNPLEKTKTNDNQYILEFVTYTKPVENTQEIFIYKDVNENIFFSTERIDKNVLNYYPHTFFVLIDPNIKYTFEQNACYPSKDGTLLFFDCVEKEKGTLPKKIIFKKSPYKQFYRILFILTIILLLFFVIRKLFRSTFFTSPLLVNVPNK